MTTVGKSTQSELIFQAIGLPTNLAVTGGGQDARATWPGHSARSLQTKVTPNSTPNTARVLVLKRQFVNGKVVALPGLAWVSEKGVAKQLDVGGVDGVEMNTMLMTVFERTHEIGILSAVGWRRRRIVAMVLCESALSGLLGGFIGAGPGVLGLITSGASPGVRGFIEPDLNPKPIVISIAISVAVGVISGLYPAWRSSRLTPILALQS